MTPSLLAYTPSPEFWALMGILATGIVKLGMDWNKRREERLDRIAASEAEELKRESLRKDIKLVASISEADREEVARKLEAIEKAGANRLKTLIQSNVTTRQYAKKAIDAGNHVTEKFNTLTQALIDNKDTPQQVEVVNTEEHPVITENINP